MKEEPKLTKNIFRNNPPYIRLPFERERQPLAFEGQGLTHQEHKEECDINRIMDRYQKTGLVDHRNEYQGRYEDLRQVPVDFHEAMNVVTMAQQMFDALPSGLRNEFRNDAGAFVDFVSNPENEDAMREMGLLPSAEQSKAVKAAQDAAMAASQAEGTEADSEPSTGETGA